MKILLTSVSAGSGHVSAARAIQAALWQTHPEVEVRHVDVMNFVSSHFRRMYTGGYQLAVDHAPRLWGRLYDYWDRTAATAESVTWLRQAQRHQAASFFRYLSGLQPDLVITTHFLVPQLLLQADQPWAGRIPIECVITDFDLHRFWISPNILRYYVAHDRLAERLASEGVPESRIVVSGIPVHPAFLAPLSKAAIRQRLGLESQKPVLLLLAGGFGLSVLERTVQDLLTLGLPIQMMAVAGKNEGLKRRLDRLRAPSHMKLLVQGYVRNMHELLAVSDLVITKPGGLTLSECQAMGKPALLCDAIPGQEERNADYAVSCGMALKAAQAEDIPGLVQRYLGDEALQRRLKAGIALHARPCAAYTIAEISLQNMTAAA